MDGESLFELIFRTELRPSKRTAADGPLPTARLLTQDPSRGSILQMVLVPEHAFVAHVNLCVEYSKST